MKVNWKNGHLVVVGTLTFGLVVGMGEGASAQEKPQQVAKVIDIDGPQLKTNRLKESKWYQAYQTMPTFYKERLEADSKTTATIEFLVGGKAVIAPGTEVEVLNKEVLKVKSGTVWAQFDKQKLAGENKRFQIQTAGGVMGIEGTEFIVKANPDGTTELIVVEGAVSVNDNMVTPGNQATFGRQSFQRKAFHAATDPIGAIRDAAFQNVDPATRSVLRPVVNRALWYGISRGRLGRFFYSRELWYARRAARFVSNPEDAAVDEAASQVSRRVGFGLGGAMRRAHNDSKPKPIRSIDINNSGSLPTFTWDEVKRADQYSVVLAKDQEATDVVWYGTVPQSGKPSITYPSYGPELASGTSYWLFVSPQVKEKKDGEEMYVPQTLNGKHLGHTMRVSGTGHTPVYGDVNGAEAMGATGTPEVRWKEVAGARTYQVMIQNASGETVWSDEVSGTSYTYPATARALPSGEYSARVEAYDSTGIKMAETKATVAFSSPGWEAAGLDGPPREEDTQGALPVNELLESLRTALVVSTK